MVDMCVVKLKYFKFSYKVNIVNIIILSINSNIINIKMGLEQVSVVDPALI